MVTNLSIWTWRKLRWLTTNQLIPAGYDHYELYLYHVAYNRAPTGIRPPSCGPKRLPISAWADPDFRQGSSFIPL